MLNFCPFCGKNWTGTPFCAYCGKSLQAFLNAASQTDDSAADPTEPAIPDLSLDFESLTAEASKTALAISLEPFEVEESGDGKYTIISLKRKNASELTVPDCVDIIAEGAFEGCKAYTVHLPEGLLRIDARAFADAPYLERINIPSTVKDIGNEAFAGCEQLDITIPANVRQGRDVMKNTLPWQKAETKRKEEEAHKARLAEEKRYAEERALFSAEGGVISDDHVLVRYSCNKREVVIPKGVTRIGERAFENNLFIVSVVIPDGVTSIENRAFSGCNNLASITLPDSLTSIGKEAFYGCNNLASITLPDSLTSIGEQAFFCCTGLTKIAFPESLTSIGGGAFIGCSGIKSVTIPAGVTQIGYNPFQCEQLKKLNVAPENSRYHSFANCVIETASKILIAGCSESVIPMDGSVTDIGTQAFQSSKELKSITIPDCVKSIGSQAFCSCTSLTSIIIPQGVRRIEDGTFWMCEHLSRITIPDSVTNIDEYAFSECSSLSNITIPNRVKSIGKYAFFYCSGLTSITIPNSVTSIGPSALGGYYLNLKSITLPRRFESQISDIGIYPSCIQITYT